MKIRIFPVLLIVLLSVLILIFMAGCSVNNNQQQNNRTTRDETGQNGTENGALTEDETGVTNTPTPEQTAEEEGYKSGMYKVGQDIPAGEYKLYSTGSFTGLSYFEVAKDSTGTLQSIIANDNFYSFTYVTVKDGQYLKFTDARAVPVDRAKPSGPENGKYSSGMYKVGFDIPPGEYQFFPEDESTIGYGYYEITSSSSHSLEDIISNENFEAPRYITLKEGQYVNLSEAYIRAK